MFEHLFAERGLSLDRLKTLIEVAKAGSIAAAARGDSARQSLYSRQIKEIGGILRCGTGEPPRESAGSYRSRVGSW